MDQLSERAQLAAVRLRPQLDQLARPVSHLAIFVGYDAQVSVSDWIWLRRDETDHTGAMVRFLRDRKAFFEKRTPYTSVAQPDSDVLSLGDYAVTLLPVLVAG